MKSIRKIGALAISTAMLLPTFAATSCSVEDAYINHAVVVEDDSDETLEEVDSETIESNENTDATEGSYITKDKAFNEKVLEFKNAVNELDSSEFGSPYFTINGINGKMFLTIPSGDSTVYFDYVTGSKRVVIVWETDNEGKDLGLVVELEYSDGYQISYNTVISVNGTDLVSIIENFDSDSKNSENDFGKFEEDRSQATRYSHQLDSDVKTMFARAVLFMDYSLNELGYSREDFGIVLDSSYENYDPYSPLAGEFFEANADHDFVDGVCTDCGLLWAKCLGDRIKTWDSTYHAGKSIASIKSYDYPNLINPGDYVEIKFKDDFYIEFIYRNDSYEEYPIEFIFGTFADDRMGAMNLAFNYDGVEISNVNSTYIDGSYTIDLQDNLENINQYIADPAALKANAFTSYANDYDATIPAEVWDLYFEYLPIMLDAFEYEANNCGYTLEDLGFNCQ